jgi:amidohydrolase
MAASTGRWTAEARRVAPSMRRWRADFHREPELAYEERRTQAKIVAALEAIGVPYRTFPKFTGVVGEVGAGRPGPVVALRADMDGLPVVEATGWRNASRIPGAMHACGHDVHLAALLGAAAVLKRRERSLGGPVTLLFQPAEEQGERGGARPLLDRGALRDPRASFVLGQHVAPEIPLGQVGWKKGAMMASADRFLITVHGTGGHAAMPHLGPDAIVVASEIVQGLQALVSRATDPLDPVVISVGSIHGGTRHNILPDSVVLEGTVRTLSPETRRRTESLLRRRVRRLAESLGATATVSYYRGYPVTVNHPDATETVAGGLATEFGEAALTPLERPVMGAEDFSRYLEQVPGAFLFLGVGRRGRAQRLHSPGFLPPDESLTIGAAVLLAGTAALQSGGS